MNNTINSYPLVTILLPVYNCENTINRCINSIKSQIETNFIVIISDNKSSDKTKDIIKNAIKNDTRFRLICQQNNIGALNNFKCLINYVTTKYAMFLGSDDYVSINFLSESIKILEKEKSISIVFPNIIYNYLNENYFGKSIKILSNNPPNRLFKYFLSVTDNGVFYSLVRSTILVNSINNLFPILYSNGIDHFVTANILINGKAEKSNSIFLFRDIGIESMKYKNLDTLELIKKIQIDSYIYIINFYKLIKINDLYIRSYLFVFSIIFFRNFIKRPLGILGSTFIKQPLLKFLLNEKN